MLVRRRDLERHIKSRHQEGAEWDLDPDNDDHDDVDVEVDVGDETHGEDEEAEDEEAEDEKAIHCNGSSLRKRRAGADIAIPTA